jgi:hypothetical protein
MTAKTEAPVKRPRHIEIAMRHMLKQREKQLAIRDKANVELKELDEALLALGWGEES